MKEKKLPEKNEVSPSSQLLSIMKVKDHAEHHYNFHHKVDYIVSSGSLLLDYILDGGYRPGVHRHAGCTEGGKTSCAFAFMRNFLKTGENRFGFYVQAERSLSKSLSARLGVEFVSEAEQWKPGTCFVYKGNVYEHVFTTIQQLIKNNPGGANFFFIIDSLDMLVTLDGLSKSYTDAQKVAAGALMTSLFLKRMGAAFSELGHICIMISQVRSSIQINPYAEKEYRQTNASGGNAVQHGNDFCLEFLPRYKKDLILDGDEIVGHNCNIIIRKSTNETTNRKISYPVRYKQVGDRVNWREREIFTCMSMFNYMIKAGAWISFSPEFVSLCKENLVELPEKLQGEAAVFKFLDENAELVDKLHKIFYNVLVGSDLPVKTEDLE